MRFVFARDRNPTQTSSCEKGDIIGSRNWLWKGAASGMAWSRSSTRFHVLGLIHMSIWFPPRWLCSYIGSLTDPFWAFFWSGLGKFGSLKEKSWFSLLKEARDAGQAKITVSTSRCLCNIISQKDGGEKALMVSISATKDTHESSRQGRGS